jgi:hypothetical protein
MSRKLFWIAFAALAPLLACARQNTFIATHQFGDNVINQSPVGGLNGAVFNEKENTYRLKKSRSESEATGPRR